MSTKDIIAYAKSGQEIISKLNTNIQTGLTQVEVKSRLEQYGENTLKEEETRSLLQKFIDQFKDFMIIVLLVASIVSAFVGYMEGEGPTDSIIILIVVLLNAILGVFQEAKAEDAINALRDMSSPEANVLRDGSFSKIKSTELVPGDIVSLEAGDIVPADLRLVETNSLKVEEAALTGESVPVEKHAEQIIEKEAGIGDRSNMAYSSTNITYGRGLGVVTQTGMDTEVGHIAAMLSSTEKQLTPLQKDQEKLGKTLTYLIIAIAILTFIVGVFFKGFSPIQMLLVSISLAVAAIPEGLPAISTIILSLGTQTMAERNALVRTLPAVETLGSTKVICSDKTGTLTLNQMTVEKVYYNGKLYDAKDPIDVTGEFIRSFAFPNDTKIDAQGNVSGDPTETALVQYALDHEMDLTDQLNQFPRVEEIPFDSSRKLMSTIHKASDGRFIVFVKGAPDQLIQRSKHILKDQKVLEMTSTTKEEILEENAKLGRQALRVLAGAFKIIDEIPTEVTTETLENNLVFTGLVGMIDPERTEAKASIEKARLAGIRTVMITGDHAMTAQAIAERLTILDPNDSENERHVMTGDQLDEISDDQLAKEVENYAVYARVSPEHKVRIIRAWQANDAVVSMTGDGVNDAPSLKQADIGVGMGITGTEVSKGASDMVLADDNFQTIVVAVEEGRKVFANIQKAVQFLLSANLGEVITLFTATLFGWVILEPIHILWINLVTDVFPAIALGMEKAESDVMSHRPRTKKDSFLSFGVAPSILYQGILEALITLFVYWYAAEGPMHTHLVGDERHVLAETMAFITLGLIQLFHAYNVKSVFTSLFSRNPFDNKWLNLAFLVSGAMLLGVVLIPGISQFFDVHALTGGQWGIVIAAAVSIVVVVEIVKLIMRASGFTDKYNR
ncbi:cation-translocating P-type ATPase [Facklamia miroungae]|uniref:P-type Ca(2+) transporter n=1 Tax=Facklamia miroungae TaxID=120956 RepID=A0A1G7T763_9LACT|nr:cation-translocating P-type ATPase [Facklamia miroungae]NKZ29685.1 cation-translocating P-type ATPase [Facklamia miroungae]SDG30912.1 Ca2+-transporting ATPase [Facklamia miroungae]